MWKKKTHKKNTHTQKNTPPKKKNGSQENGYLGLPLKIKVSTQKCTCIFS